ncbi:MAG: LPS export ABC transporter periplasmic protein LptC [Candidatus Latescibacteria bacterium]|nr:LPS export ABC transporter periplasmic protein LptC [Candidatus Latescibacterota bacterium]MDP7235768.1 LPS export ABC transporter periplasmic protein LptC [Candidatus Latescibacterota bacterium]
MNNSPTHQFTNSPTYQLRLLCLLILLLGCQEIKTPAYKPNPEDLPDQEAWNTTIYLSQDGRQRAMVKAAHRLHYAATQSTVIDQGIYVEFYDEDGLTSSLEAERGIIDEHAHNLWVKGNVVIKSLEHGTLETDSLQWLEEQNLIETEAHVKLFTERDIITGQGFEADPGLKNWTIHRNIRGRFIRDENDKEDEK